jgi:glycosyltransferase involved in cell wall biosynthesis
MVILQQDIQASRPKLFIFTLTYPYSGAAEANFLHPELNILEKTFEIILVPRKIEGTIDAKSKSFLVDLSFAELMAGSKPRGIDRFRRLISLDFLFELIKSNQKMLDLKVVSRIAVDHLLGSFALDWVKLNKRLINESRSIIYGWWLTPEILKIASSRMIRESVVVARAHGGDLYEFRDEFGIKPFRSRYIANLDGLYPISNDGYMYLRNRYQNVEQILSVLHLGTDDHGIGVTPNTDSKVFHIVSCSFVTPIKQLQLAVHGVSMFASSCQDLVVKWTHFGDGPGRKELLAEYEQSGGFEFEVRSFGEISQLINFYQTVPINVFINTSKSEGVPVTMIEAASFGIPLIGPNVGGVSEIVKVGDNGFLMQPESIVNDLGSYLNQIHNLNGEEYSKLRNLSRDTWSEEFRSDTVYADFADRLMRLIHCPQTDQIDSYGGNC